MLESHSTLADTSSKNETAQDAVTLQSIKFQYGHVKQIQASRLESCFNFENIYIVYCIDESASLVIGQESFDISAGEYAIINHKHYSVCNLTSKQADKKSSLFILEIDQNFCKNFDNIYHQTSSILQIEPQMASLYVDIVNCNFENQLKEFYLKAKLTELLCYTENQLVNLKFETELKLPDSIVKQMYMARDILVADLKAKISLNSLARTTGTNENYLKKYFKQLFGDTVFGYLNNYKMKVAKQMLRSKSVSINQVAIDLGYKNTSNFSANFYKYYGFLPKRIKSTKFYTLLVFQQFAFGFDEISLALGII